MKRFASLAVLLLLVALCAPASSHASTAAVCAQPSCVFLPITQNVPPVMVANLWDTLARDSSLRFGGFVATTGDQPVSDVVIEVAFYDTTNQVIGTWSGTTALTTTLPGQENPFEIFTSARPDFDPAFGSGRTDVHVISWSMGNPRNERTLTVLNIVITGDGPLGIVHAELRNDTGVPLTNVRIVAWGDQQGQRIFARSVADYLAPGATIPAAISINMYVGNPHVSAQGTPAL